jgi:hypothetical protein
VTPPPHSPPHEALLSLEDLFHWQAGVTIATPRSNWTWIEIGPLTGSPLSPAWHWYYLIHGCSMSRQHWGSRLTYSGFCRSHHPHRSLGWPQWCCPHRVLGEWSPRPKKLSYGLFCWCPLHMRVKLSIVCAASTFPVPVHELKRWCLGGRSRASTTLIVHRSIACPVTPLHWPMMVPSAVSVGDLTKVPPSS